MARSLATAEIEAGLREAYTQIEKGGRTADPFEVWLDDYLDQVAVAWVLGCVFVRFMEDNHLIDECWLSTLAQSMAGKLGGKIGIAPRLFLKKLVSDVLDRIDQFDDFDPRVDYELTVSTNEMTRVEREAQAKTVDDIELDI